MPDHTDIKSQVIALLSAMSTPDVPYDVMGNVAGTVFDWSTDNQFAEGADVTINGNVFKWWWTVLFSQALIQPKTLTQTSHFHNLIVQTYMVFNNSDIDGAGNGSLDIFQNQVFAVAKQLTKNSVYRLPIAGVNTIITRGSTQVQFFGAAPGLLNIQGDKAFHGANITLPDLEIVSAG